MSSKRMFWRLTAGLTVALTLAGFATAASAWPDKPVRVIVPFAPGGATDVVARSLGARLAQIWGQQVIVENRPGAGGNIGADIVAKAAADGYTLLMASPAEVAINQFLYAQMAYDPARDLTPVTKVASAPLVLVVHPGVPARSVGELIGWLKASKDGVNYASSGTGGPQHLAAEQFRLMTGTRMVHVPYKGGAPAITDLVGGQVPMFFAGLPPALPHIQAGRLRALAVTTAQRSSLAADLPTIATTLPGFDIENWQGMFAPAGTPATVVAKIAADVASVTREGAFKDQLSGQGAAPVGSTPAEFAAFVQAEREKYRRLVKESGAKVE